MRIYNSFTKQFEDIVPGCQTRENNYIYKNFQSTDNFSWTNLISLVENVVNKYIYLKPHPQMNYAFHRDPLYFK